MARKQKSVFIISGYTATKVSNKCSRATPTCMDFKAISIEKAIKQARRKGLFGINTARISTGSKIGDIK